MRITQDSVRKALDEIRVSRPLGQRLDQSHFHPFPARMPASVVEHMIRSFSDPQATVLDPMAGSGTTLIAARRLGRRAIGIERDPLALLLSRCAISEYDPRDLELLRLRVLRRARELLPEICLQEVRQDLPQEDQGFVKYWFPSPSQKQLFALAQAIRTERNRTLRDLAWVVFSSLIIAKTTGVSYAVDISRSRPHKRTDKPLPHPLEVWDRRFRTVVSRLPFTSERSPVQGTVYRGDARSLPVEEDSVDLILTSPPYLNAVDYLRTHKFSLIWMKYSLKELRELRGTMLGTERGLWSPDGVPKRIEEQIANTVDCDRKAAHIRQYLSDLKKVLHEMHRVLRLGGAAVLVVGPSIVSSLESDAAEVIGELAREVALEPVGSAVRSLSPIRRSLPFLSSDTNNPLAYRMCEEVIVVLRK